MHRFFVAPGTLRSGASVNLDAFAHQLHVVLRQQPGADLLLLDGSGLEYSATLTALSARQATADVGAAHPCATEPHLQITLYMCSLKGEKFAWVLQKCTELGVVRFVPVVSSRSVVRPAAALDGKAERWRAVIREAAEQARRAILPALDPALDFAAAITQAQGLRLLPWEGAAGGAVSAFAPASVTQVSLLIGPEGGLAEDEAAAAQAAGWQVVSLGPRILRAETAAIAGVAALLAQADDLGALGRL
jgi:16S rRNA (uracil1498-N3)-methyltransferase